MSDASRISWGRARILLDHASLVPADSDWVLGEIQHDRLVSPKARIRDQAGRAFPILRAYEARSRLDVSHLALHRPEFPRIFPESGTSPPGGRRQRAQLPRRR